MTHIGPNELDGPTPRRTASIWWVAGFYGLAVFVAVLFMALMIVR